MSFVVADAKGWMGTYYRRGVGGVDEEAMLRTSHTIVSIVSTVSHRRKIQRIRRVAQNY